MVGAGINILIHVLLEYWIYIYNFYAFLQMLIHIIDDRLFIVDPFLGFFRTV